MIPTRQKLIGENKVEEYNFANLKYEKSVYINDKRVDETFDHVVARLEEALDIT